MNNFMDLEEISKASSKLSMYKRESDLNFDGFKEIFINLNNYYKTDNINETEDIQRDFVNRFKTISNIHNNNILVFNSNVKSYREVALKNANQFDKLG